MRPIILATMDPVRIGRSLRAIRLHLGMRQEDVAHRARISASSVSLVERGFVGRLSMVTLERIVGAVGADINVVVRWRGGALDRLLDARHAALAESVVRLLRHRGWETLVEVTYSSYGERGSIDVLAVRRPERVALVIELKSEITAIEETGRKLDEKVRMARQVVCPARYHVRPAVVGRLLVLPDRDAARRRVASHPALFDAMLPDRGAVVRRWLKAPNGELNGILFVADSNARGTNGARIGAKRRA